MAGTYIQTTDITDMILLETGIATEMSAKVDASDDAVEDLANRKGVEADDIETSPVHYKVKEYAIAWVGMKLCFDMTGKNGVELADVEKYWLKYKEYKSQVQQLESEINSYMLAGTDTAVRDRATAMSGLLFRN